MRISVINVGLFCLCFLSNAYATSDEWSQRWKASSNRSNENLVQANLIELKESDYYSGLGKTTIHSTSTTSIGTVNTPTNNINVEGTDNNIDISSELLNEAPVNSNTNQNPQRCLNLSTQSGESLC
ncbi:hypothetical protein [Acinetobacter sp. ANC 5414]|jgi:hypothetical protein|uniref:hypothetical protein n=1 Tax=Acinetobacter sp. ANC 5414 TaxID=2731251 RepID=UPI00148FA8CB|nr:hypothetical protein [Acinetobacter sp. ANC 5414]NNH02182.1 hypothetical protein [Acinetobacter sp. ANC 5414]